MFISENIFGWFVKKMLEKHNWITEMIQEAKFNTYGVNRLISSSVFHWDIPFVKDSLF